MTTLTADSAVSHVEVTIRETSEGVTVTTHDGVVVKRVVGATHDEIVDAYRRCGWQEVMS